MLAYDLLAVYAAIAGWSFWVATRNDATMMQSIIVSLLWPVVVVLPLAVLLWSGGDQHIPEDA